MSVKGTKEISVEEKLRALFDLQLVDSEIDKIKTLRGELPLEVQDLEDEIAGLNTRIAHMQEDIRNFETLITGKKSDIEVSKGLIERYQGQQENVRNNREYENLSKEIEFQTLEIELCEKKIREFNAAAKQRREDLERAQELINDRSEDLAQ